MTNEVFYMILATAALAVLCVVAWYLVAFLKQARRTAAAAELFIESTRPRVEAATDKLESLISRADSLLTVAEGGKGVVNVVNGLGSALAGFTAGGKVVSMASAAVSGILEAWRTIKANRAERKNMSRSEAGEEAI